MEWLWELSLHEKVLLLYVCIYRKVHYMVWEYIWFLYFHGQGVYIYGLV